MTDPSQPLKNARHEAFAQAVAMKKPAAEAYRLAGYSPKDSDVSGPRLLGNAGITARVTAIRMEANRSSKLTKDRALELLANIAEDGERDSDRVAAMRTAGGWCGWDAPQQIEVSGSVTFAEKLSLIRSRRKQ